jgi:hypothetical protein
MKFYAINGHSPRALAVYDAASYDEACTRAAADFGDEVVVLDQKMYCQDQEFASVRFKRHLQGITHIGLDKNRQG